MRNLQISQRRVVRELAIRASGVACCIILCLVLTAILRGDEPAKESAPGEMQWSAESSHTVLPASGQSFWVRLRLHAPELKQAEREPLNLSVVFDRSMSMNIDSKIGFVRKAGHILADNLKPRDDVSLIAYNHEVPVSVAMHPVINREYLHHRIDELTAVGDTNISGGFLEGCAQLEKRLGRRTRCVSFHHTTYTGQDFEHVLR